MAMYCFGCGCDITDSRVKRSLYSDASEHVRPLWCELFDKELVSKGIELQAQRLITSESGKMCRKCFAMFERCAKLLDSIRLDVAKAVEILQQCNSLISFEEEITCNTPSTPAPKRAALATDSASPDVVVIIRDCMKPL